MPCYAPMQAWRGTRDRAIYWRKINDCSEITLACGQCWGCRLERSRQWALRCLHESKLHKHNCFITLTYNDKHMPERYNTGLKRPNGDIAYGGNLRYRDVQLFLKKLRWAIHNPPVGGLPIATNKDQHHEALSSRQKKPWHALSYYLAGEYGALYARPHWHICMFGIDFTDKTYHRTTATGSKLYTSKQLEKLWPWGYSSIGQLTYESAAYVARYVMKKITGDPAKEHYTKIDTDTGEIIKLTPEFNRMSKKPAIAKRFIEQYLTDVYPHGYVINKAKKTKPPIYYDRYFKKQQITAYTEMKELREIAAIYQWEEQTPERLRVREQVARAKTRSLQRNLA